jgi:peptidoglycan/xylan/chitin deacetylase (PgdA/CDA1 family)
MSTLSFSLSVDDGHPLDLRIADMLARHNFRASFYLPIRNCEAQPVMSGVQARELAQRFEVGSHTLDHQYLTTLSDEAAWRQIVEGKTELEQRLGKTVNGFCYPGGRYRDRHVQMVRRAGFCYARTTQNLYPHSGHARFCMPTALQFYPHSRSVLIRNFLSQGAYRTRWPALRAVIMEPDWLVRLYRLFDHLEHRGSVFHLWCHAIDIERLQLWRALDHFLSFIARRIPAGRRLDNAGLLGPLSAGRDPVTLMLPDHEKVV